MDFAATYARMFAKPDYSEPDPFLFRYSWAIAHAISLPKNSVVSCLDVGAGRGVFLRYLESVFPAAKIAACDLRNFHGSKVEHFDLDLADPGGIIRLSTMRYKYVSCLDVLEHLPEKAIGNVLCALSACCERASITIANHSDIHDGIELHLIQQGRDWWKGKIDANGFSVAKESHHYNGTLYAFWLNSRASENKPA